MGTCKHAANVVRWSWTIKTYVVVFDGEQDKTVLVLSKNRLIKQFRLFDLHRLFQIEIFLETVRARLNLLEG